MFKVLNKNYIIIIVITLVLSIYFILDYGIFIACAEEPIKSYYWGSFEWYKASLNQEGKDIFENIAINYKIIKTSYVIDPFKIKWYDFFFRWIVIHQVKNYIMSLLEDV